MLLSLLSLCLLPSARAAAPHTHARALCAARAASRADAAHSTAMAAAMKSLYAEALWGFRRACELEPGSALYWNDLGVTLLRAGRLEGAAAAFGAALAIDPAFDGAEQNLRETRAAQEGQLAQEQLALDAHGELAGAAALQARAMALDELEAALAQDPRACEAAAPVRLAPPLGDSAYAAFKAATGIRHSVQRLPRVRAADIGLPENAAFARGDAPYILTAAPSRAAAAALARAADAAALARGPCANDTADFYPESMVEHTVHPYLVPLARALGELAAPSGDFPLSAAPRGGRYLHFNMGTDAWRDYMAALAPVAVPPHLATPDAWLARGLGEPLATDFLIGNHWRMLLVGSEGAGMFHHQDLLKTASFQLQVAGVKTWHICAPSESPHLDVALDMFAPDYARFPQGLRARCFLDAVEPGEFIYYPADYWHQTLNTPARAGELVLALTDTLVDASNFERVKAGLRDKCAAPTPFNRGGMIQAVCDRMPNLFRVWDEDFAAAA